MDDEYIIDALFGHLYYSDLRSCAQVCHRWYTCSAKFKLHLEMPQIIEYYDYDVFMQKLYKLFCEGYINITGISYNRAHVQFTLKMINNNIYQYRNNYLLCFTLNTETKKILTK